MRTRHSHVGVQRKGVIALPTEHWQQREREVDDHVASGRVTRFDSNEDFLGHLDSLDDSSE